MKPTNLVDRLLEDHSEGANLTVKELEDVYHVDYTGDFGLIRATYTGKSDGGKGEDHRYIALFHNDMAEGEDEEWYVTDIYVKHNKDGKMTMDFGGSPLFTSGDRTEAETWLDKESHVKGGSKDRTGGQACALRWALHSALQPASWPRSLLQGRRRP